MLRKFSLPPTHGTPDSADPSRADTSRADPSRADTSRADTSRADTSGRPTRRRDRHGRGPRGPLVPTNLPGHQTRAEQFDEMVLDAVERLEKRWSKELDGVEIAVEDVPPGDPAPWEDGEVPLGRFFPASGALAVRIVVYRRPLETRAPDRSALEPMVHQVVVEQVAHLLGLEPSVVDPRYDAD